MRKLTPEVGYDWGTYYLPIEGTWHDFSRGDPQVP